MAKKYWRPPPDYYDEELKHAKRVAEEIDVQYLLKYGTEEDIRNYAKKWNPGATDAELDKIVSLFRDAKSEHGPGRR
jgi:hypothetical protein